MTVLWASMRRWVEAALSAVLELRDLVISETSHSVLSILDMSKEISGTEEILTHSGDREVWGGVTFRIRTEITSLISERTSIRIERTWKGASQFQKEVGTLRIPI